MKRLSLLWILLIGLVLAAPAQAAIDVNNSFSPATIYPSQTSNLQIRLLNSSLEPVTDVALTNSLPANVQLATTPNISSDCGGTFNIANGQITLSGGTIPASDGKNAGVCLLSADVTVSKKGTYVHTIATGEVTGISSTGAQSNTQDSKGTLVVLLQDLTLTLSNASGDLYLHGYETDFIRYTFTNPNPVAVTNLTLSQSLYSNPNSIRFVDDGSGTNTCGGTVSLTKGTSTDVTNFNITGGSVPANGSCTVQVKVENRRDPKLPYNFYYSSNPISANKVTTNEGATNSNSATSAVLSRSGVTVRKAFGSSSVNLYKDPTTTLTITIESDNTQAIDNFNFTDVMPTSSAGDGTMTVKSITGNTCGGTASHDATSLTITNGVLDAASATGSTPARCIISATVSYDKAGTYINTIPAGDLNTYQYASATANIVVSDATANIVVSDRLLEINKALTRAYMYQGDTNTVTLTLTNYATDFSVTNIDLKDDLNSMCVGATCPNAGMRIWGGGTISNTCGGTVIAPADATVFELRDATIAAGQTCKVSFGIKASADSYPYGGNTYVRTNTIPVGDITYDTPTQTGLIYPIDVTGKVTVYASMRISIKPFVPSTVAPMGQSRAGMTLTRTMYDPNATSNIRFEYPLPAGHVFADDVELVNGCGGTVTAIPGTSTITLSGAALPAANGASYTATSAYASSCTISFNIKAPNTSETDSFRAPGQAHGAQTFFSATDDSQSAPYNVLENYSSYSASLTRRATSVAVNKEFSPVSINGGGKSRVRIVFANTESTSINLTKVTLTDSFSNTDMRLFTDINPTFANTSNQTNSSGCRGGTFAGEPGGTSITLANAEIDANSTCYFEFNITAHKGGNHINTIAAGDLVTFEGVTNPADVAATLTVGRQVNVGKGFYPNVISLGETSTLLLDFFNTNTQPNDEIGTSSALVDEMPSGIQIVGTPTTTCEGGTVSTGVNASGKHYLQLSGGKFPAEGACRISATVKTTAIGTFTNTIAANDLNTVSGATNPDAVSADLKVVTKPTITKYFSPAYIKPGATTNLTFTVNNPNNSTTLPTGLTGITFTDNLVDMKIASPLSVSGTCTGYKSNAVVDGTSFTVSNLRLSPSGSCTISIPVTASRVGTLPNEASGVTSDQNATPSAVAKANLYTYQPTTLTKTFNPKQILAGGTSVLTLTITNPNATTVNLMGTTSLTDLFPSSPGQMVLAATPNIQKSAGCSRNISIMDPSNTRTAAAGDTGIVIKNGYLVASSTCTISMNVTASVDGEYVNTTSALDTAANLAPAATATLSVGAPKISGVVFEDVNYGGGAGRDFTTAAGKGVNGATVELYKADGTYVGNTTTANDGTQDGVYTFNQVLDGSYYVRVVSDTVNSTRVGSDGTELGVQTFRTDGTTAVTNEVGGHKPSIADGAANTGAETLDSTNYKLSGGAAVQSLQAVTMAGADLSGVEFGFNFDTIVNTNDSGQGSLRQFVLNANLLDNANLDQVANSLFDPAAGFETSIFMIPNAQLANSGANQGAAVITITSPISSAADNTAIDARTQTANIGNTNAGQLGTGGKVGVDGLTLDKIERPEVVVKASGGVALNFNGNNGVLRGIAGYGASLASANYMVLNKTSVVDGNLIGALADGSAPDNSEQNDYISLRINAASTITNNLFAYSPYGILTTSSTAAEIRNNEFAHLGSAYGNNRQEGDGISIQSPATVVGNLFHDMQGAYDASGGSYLEVLGLTTASNNTFKGAQRSAVRLLTNSVKSIISKNIITGSIAGSGVEAIANNVSVASGTITQNSIYANHTLGIDLGSNGVTLNDANDSDTGVNNLLNFPLFKEVLNVNGQLVIKGCAPAGATLELYEADVSATSASGVMVGSNKLNKTQDYGEGERYLISLVEGVGEDTVTTPVDCATLTDSDANSAVGMSPFQWTLTMPTEFVVGDKLTATATVSGSGTSEFSPLSALHLYQDRGDALASYGDPTHTITDGLYLGMQLPDRDDTTLYSAGADGDGADEDGVSTLATLTTVTQTYSTNVMVTNQLGKEAWLVGWIDFNRNGTFDSNEAASIAVSAGSQHKTLGLTWSNLNGLVAGNTYLRLRLTTDPSVASAAVRDATAAALDGEVEDYKLTIKVAGQALSGTVFKDRNANGSNDTETGIGKVIIVLEDKATTTCRSVKTNAKGHYQFSGLANGDYVVYEAAPETVPTPETCPPVAADPTGYQSSTANSYAVTINDADISNQDFGDIANPSFTLDNSLVTQPNTTVAHSHIFRTEVDGNVTLSLLEENLDPSDLLWKTQLLRDNNCDGKLNKGDTVINGAISLNAGDKLCVLTKVLTPANASSGATQTLTLQSEFTYGDGSVVTATNKQTRTDITKVNGDNSDAVVNGAGKLDLKKSVWNVTRNQSGETALPGETLRYTIQYENIGDGVLDELIVHDALPNFTDLVTGSPTCVQTPTELSLCTPQVTDTAIDWSYVGKLPAGANGKVSYEVTVQ